MDEDVQVIAKPKEDKATMTPLTDLAKDFFNIEYGDIEERDIPSDDINNLFSIFKEKGIRFSFKLA